MIRLKNVSFRYEERPEGVFDIDLSVRAGECVVLTGPSGGGKTTLTRLISGLAPAYFRGALSGKITIDGEDASGMPLWGRGKRIGSVFQDPKSQFFSSELAGEVAFACENYGFPWAEIAARTDRAISAFHLESLRHRSLDGLSGGEKQRVAIASVYALGPQAYVCDEPTANLDEEGTAQLAHTLRKLKAEGHALVVAEHRLSWLNDLADRFVYVRDGRILWEKTPAEMDALSDSDRASYGLRRSDHRPPPDLPLPSGQGAPSIAAESLGCKRGKNTVWSDVSLSAWPGQAVALTGRNGVGKTTLALALSGLCRINRGGVLLEGASMPARRRRKRVWYGANDTGTQFFTDSVASEVLLGKALDEDVLEKARVLLKQTGLYGLRDCHPATLSGGQRQRLSVVCGLLSEREILILDEPTSGLDGGNMCVMADILKHEASAGKTILVITHDAEFIDACCRYRIGLCRGAECGAANFS